ncbi:MAG: methyltransferase domain-containing protein [Hymenobacteraceae bacterium]|nr:methyltransferase domain-containing protein [Hymenobacteraceae bacterium]
MRLLLLLFLLPLVACREPRNATTPPPAPAASSTALDPNGIGKVYMGRQIAQVMGHEGADWLERAGRDREEATDVLVRELRLHDTDIVADIGAGTGYFTFRLAPLVPNGRVKAVDLQLEMIDVLEERKRKLGADNVDVVLGTEQSPGLAPNSITLALFVDAYHEFAYPREMMTGIYKALRPGGRVALVEFKAEDSGVAIKAVHKMSVAQCKREMAAVGLTFREARPGLPQQHLLIFEKSAE